MVVWWVAAAAGAMRLSPLREQDSNGLSMSIAMPPAGVQRRRRRAAAWAVASMVALVSAVVMARWVLADGDGDLQALEALAAGSSFARPPGSIPRPAEGAGAPEAVTTAAESAAELTPIRRKWQEVKAALPQLGDVEDARMGFTAEKQYVFSQGNASRENPIYKRKMEVLGMTINQQTNYMKAFKRAVRAAKEVTAVQELAELVKDRKRDKNVAAEVEDIIAYDRSAQTFFSDILPEVLDNPIANTITGILSTLALVIMTLLFCVCFFPPVVPED